MFLCIERGSMYVTDAPEPMLKGMKRIDPSFHYETIEYAHAESIKAHLTVERDGTYHEVIKDMAREYRASRKAKIGLETVLKMMKSLKPEELEELLKER